MSEKQKQKDADVQNKNVQYELLNLSEDMLDVDRFDEVFKSYPVTDNTKCGFGLLQGSWLQM